MGRNLLLVFALLPSVCFGSDRVDKNIVGLTKDCEHFIKESVRVQDMFSEYQQELKQFNTLVVQDGSSSNYNRAHLWTKVILFDLDQGVKDLNRLHEHCVCLSSDIKVPKYLQLLLGKVKGEYGDVSTKKKILVKDIQKLQNEAFSNLY